MINENQPPDRDPKAAIQEADSLSTLRFWHDLYKITALIPK
jgi:hypothetical protein